MIQGGKMIKKKDLKKNYINERKLQRRDFAMSMR